MNNEHKETNRLPKLYRPVTVSFSSLRNGLGSGLGMIFDVDTIVERKAMLVLMSDNSKAWQICGQIDNDWDYFILQDQEILTMYKDEPLHGVDWWAA